MRALATLVFSLAIAGSLLAGTGLVVAPHADPPGTPRYHDHVLAAYRFALFEMRLAVRIDERLRELPRLLATAPLDDVAAPLVLALLAIPLPRLARPARRPVASLATPRLAHGQWAAPLASGPPRPDLLAAV